jgi:hypothetical protein
VPNDWSRPVSDGPDDDDWLAAQQPDLGPLREAAERAELADAKSCLASSYGFPLRDDDPLAPLARDLAEALTLAGFTLHRCAQSDPLHRLGGVCLLPVAQKPGPVDSGGVVVSWTTHKLLSLDWDRWGEHQGAQAAMNRAVGDVLCALGFRVLPFGEGGASIVSGRRVDGGRAGAGR